MSECAGAESDKGQVESLATCADECRREKSSMFAYGTNEYGVSRCDDHKCRCRCQTASSNEECTAGKIENNGYNLYAFHTPGINI